MNLLRLVAILREMRYNKAVEGSKKCGRIRKKSYWGKALYIDYDDYKDAIDSFTNILEIY